LFGRLAPGALGGLGEDQPESPPEARGSTPNPRAAPGNRPPRLSQGGRSLPPHLSGLAGNGDRTRRRSPSRGGHRHEHRSRAREKQGATIVYVFGHGHHREKMIRRHLWFRRHHGQPSNTLVHCARQEVRGWRRRRTGRIDIMGITGSADATMPAPRGLVEHVDFRSGGDW
jgi:hypothetical protein